MKEQNRNGFLNKQGEDDLQTLNGIDYLAAGNLESSKVIVIMHGYGASANDLYPLHKYWDPAGEYCWYFLNGVIDLQMSPFMPARAWFQIDMEAYERQVQTGEFRKLSATRPKGIDESRDQVLGFISKLDLAGKKLMLGGFSQGAMMSLELSFYVQPQISGLLLLSGSFIEEFGWTPQFDKLKGLKVFQTHGTGDAVLSFAEAERLNQCLVSAGAESEWLSFSGGHEIPPNVVTAATQYIKSQFI